MIANRRDGAPGQPITSVGLVVPESCTRPAMVVIAALPVLEHRAFVVIVAVAHCHAERVALRRHHRFGQAELEADGRQGVLDVGIARAIADLKTLLASGWSRLAFGIGHEVDELPSPEAVMMWRRGGKLEREQPRGRAGHSEHDQTSRAAKGELNQTGEDRSLASPHAIALQQGRHGVAVGAELDLDAAKLGRKRRSRRQASRTRAVAWRHCG